ncbi:MAG: hydrolase [Thermoleophilia bacterium]|nr:hydrolase [Thermoleophilia bacterium]
MAEPSRELVLVDARNVQRSGWPNPDDARFLAALEHWAEEDREAAGADVVLVVDGVLRNAEPTGVVEVVEVDYADDELVARATAAVATGRSVRVATSDRELRARLEHAGATVPWGGGRFLRLLGLAHGGR